MIYEVTNIRSPVSKALVVHEENEGYENLAKDASSVSFWHGLIVN